MLKKILFVDDINIRLGNILYFLAYCFNVLDCSEIKVYTNNQSFYKQRKLFKFDVIFGNPENFDLKFSDTTFDKILNANNCNFKKLQEKLNKEYIDSFRYQFDLSNLCVINLRFGDYLAKENIETYKTIKPRWLKEMIEKYNVIDTYNIVFVSDSGQMAREMSKYIGIDAPVVSNDALLCLNLLLKAKFIIGSFSTFSFAGCMLNYNNADMVVEYPYYQERNPNNWSPEKDCSIYDNKRIKKEECQNGDPVFVICTIIKDEHKMLSEWIEYNIKLGFSKIYLFEDIGSISHSEICSKYEQVILQRIENTNYLKYKTTDYGSWRQTAMMNMFIEEYRTCGDWVAFIDVDEFIVFDDTYDLKKLVSEFRNKNGIYLYWKNFGANGMVESVEGKTTDIYTKEAHISKRDYTWAYKSLVNLNSIELRMLNPHTIKNGVNTLGIAAASMWCYNKSHINHYITKSFNDYVEKMFYRGDLAPGNRSLNTFFDVNVDMAPNRETIIRNLLNIDKPTPKVIHYFWFGGNELNDIQKMCIDTWKKFAPDYEIIKWDETNYDVHKNQFIETLYDKKMYAFLSDYARSDIMYQYGGIYLDTDVELIKPIDELAKKGPFFSCGFKYGEIKNGLGYMMPSGNFIDKLCMWWILQQPLGEIFNVNKFLTNVFSLFSIYPCDKLQDLCGIKIYPTEYLDPKNYDTGIVELTENTVAIHHGTHLW